MLCALHCTVSILLTTCVICTCQMQSSVEVNLGTTEHHIDIYVSSFSIKWMLMTTDNRSNDEYICIMINIFGAKFSEFYFPVCLKFSISIEFLIFQLHFIWSTCQTGLENHVFTFYYAGSKKKCAQFRFWGNLIHRTNDNEYCQLISWFVFDKMNWNMVAACSKKLTWTWTVS